MSVFLGRQPILDDSRQTHGYELLYRHGNVDAAFFADPDDASRTVVEWAMLEWGLANLVGANGIAFINVTAEFLRSGLHLVLPADRVVLELLETVAFDDATAEAIRQAVQLGYRVALDDLVTTSTAGLDRILPLVDIVKVEVASLHPTQVLDLVATLRNAAPKVMLLAEKVETVETFELCRSLGFDLFQGYFFARPEVLRRHARPISHQAALSLMVAMQDPDISVDDLANLANTDPTLTYRLLKLVNSTSNGLPNIIESVRQAIVLLGIDQVRQLAALLSLAGHATSNRELITLAVTRAHMARHLIGDSVEANSAFTVGLLSVIDAVFKTPMNELIDDLPLTDDVRKALLFNAGPIGEMLQIIRAYERADVHELEQFRPFGLDEIREAFGEATSSAARFSDQLDTLAPTRAR